MRLSELEAKFLKIIDERTWREVASIEEADGLQLLCPKCWNDEPVGPIGTHSIICWRPRVPLTMTPGPGRWEFEGTGIEDLWLRAGSSSVLLQGEGCKAHFFVENGSIRMC